MTIVIPSWLIWSVVIIGSVLVILIGLWILGLYGGTKGWWKWEM